ncbi:hypothetical protein L1987_60641 [Smallanthus sonchifolius]|uniref:Uncharacterized protein n=1 Tax=Smallanthus sonchifolius TaxID=185202 RepID=A0ACB9D8N3_9ASTR|nr:hypothetical protein L1987_60641 [Smallanthus sonchifolius]
MTSSRALTSRRALKRNGGKEWASACGAHRAKYLRATTAKDYVVGCFEYNVDLAEALDAKQNASIDLPMDTFKCHVIREPIGVVGFLLHGITLCKWLLGKLHLLSAVGCAAILKPSEVASVT